MVSRGMRDTVLPSLNLLITSKVDQRWNLTTVSTTCRKNGILLSMNRGRKVSAHALGLAF
jgi:hypothetical protein